MDPVISPWFIYLINIIDSIKAAFTVIGAVGTLCSIFVFIITQTDFDIEFKLPIKYPIIAVALLMFSICIPNKDVLISMYVANNITYNEIEPIVSSDKDLKSAVKADILDIINEVNKKD